MRAPGAAAATAVAVLSLMAVPAAPGVPAFSTLYKKPNPAYYYNAAVAALAGASFENVANMTRPDPCAA